MFVGRNLQRRELQCNAYANPPLPFFTPGTSSSCVVSRLSQDLSGTFNVDSGGSVLDIDLNLGAHLGISPNKPCPYCTGDATPCDGVNAGTCVGGVNDGQTCDECGVNGNFPTPGGDGVSLDCFPDPNLNVSGSGLEVSLSPFTTGSVSLPFATGCDAQFAAFNCACAVCSGDPTLACVNDAECSLAGAGTCDSFGTGAVRAPNRCNTLVCNPIGGPAYAPEGYCGDICLGPYDMFCDGTLLGNGQPYYSCSADIDCEVLDPDCPGGDCGDCSIQRLRPCHIDPIAATGVQDADTPMMVSTFCIPPTLNPAINNGIGLPGPGRIVQEFETSMLCPSDPGLAYVPGVGFQ